MKEEKDHSTSRQHREFDYDMNRPDYIVYVNGEPVDMRKSDGDFFSKKAGKPSADLEQTSFEPAQERSLRREMEAEQILGELTTNENPRGEGEKNPRGTVRSGGESHPRGEAAAGGKRRSPAHLITWIIVLIILANVIPLGISGIKYLLRSSQTETSAQTETAAPVSETGVSESTAADMDSRESRLASLQADGTLPGQTYMTPTQLGDDITTGTVSLDGRLYQFPIPVSAMEKDGWKLAQDPYENDELSKVLAGTTIKPRKPGYAYMETEDGRAMDVMLVNCSSDPAPAADCAVVSVTPLYDFNQEYLSVQVQLPGGISTDMDQTSFSEAVAGLNTEAFRQAGGYFSEETPVNDTDKYFQISWPRKEAAGGEGLGPFINADFYNDQISYFSCGVDIGFNPSLY